MIDIIFDYARTIFTAMYLMSIPALLYRIGSSIYDQTDYLKDEEEIDNIGNN